MADKFFMTKEGLEAAKKQLDYLTRVKRAEIVERIQEARSHGDLSENAEYDAARNEQAANEGEISELEYKIRNAEIIEENDDKSLVHIGSVVTVYDADIEEETVYTIMGTTEADAMRGIVSNESPVGKALIGCKVGDQVEVETQAGMIQYKVLEIQRSN